jgi:glyoxylase-like metal-dependent hydrolase (beta-lactamase superfamily II)
MTSASAELFPLVYTGGPLATNAYLIPNADQTGYLCFDAPEGLAKDLREADLKVDALLVTHAHSDHVADADEVIRNQDCPLYIHADDEPLLRREGHGFEAHDAIRRVPVANGTGELNVGGRRFVLFHIPGHSRGSTAFYEPARKRIFGGDLIFSGGIGRCKSDALRAELLAGIARWILPLPDATEIYPGHGLPTLLGTERGEDYFKVQPARSFAQPSFQSLL